VDRSIDQIVFAAGFNVGYCRRKATASGHRCGRRGDGACSGGGAGGEGAAVLIAFPAGVRAWLATGHSDMRRGFDGRALLVQGAAQARSAQQTAFRVCAGAAGSRHNAQERRRPSLVAYCYLEISRSQLYSIARASDQFECSKNGTASTIGSRYSSQSRSMASRDR
jgi:hypothetical protein